jgi:hypothetical protein
MWMMKRLFVFVMLAAALAATAVAQTAAEWDNCTTTPRESKHVSGPHGLEGWTMESIIPDYSNATECFSFVLVLARNGHVIRRRDAQPVIWNWIFWNDGKQVAIVEGPLHFGMNCVLEDVETGREIESFDCYHHPSKDDPPDFYVPNWVKALGPM